MLAEPIPITKLRVNFGRGDFPTIRSRHAQVESPDKTPNVDTRLAPEHQL